VRGSTAGSSDHVRKEAVSLATTAAFTPPLVSVSGTGGVKKLKRKV